MSAEKITREARRWLGQAKEDLKAAEILLKEGRFAQSCFYSQQSAEKALKGLWFFLDEDPWGHSVCRLIEELKKEPLRTGLMEFHEDAQMLDRFYIPTRYPNGLPDLIPQDAYSKRDSQTGVAAAKKIINFIDTAID